MEVDKLLGSTPYKICQLDPAFTWLVKEMRALISPFVLLMNKSLADGCFPSVFKRAVVRPLFKKAGLDASQLKNYIDLCVTCHILIQTIGKGCSGYTPGLLRQQ